MGHETVVGFRETEETHSSGSKTAQNSEECGNSGQSDSISGLHIHTVISMPQELPSSNCCQSRSVEAAVAVTINSERRSSFSGENEKGDDTWVVDLKCGEGERVCRICHLSSEQESKDCSYQRVKTELIQLGCGCRGELGVAHLYCAEAWFKLKGNRMCEICGEIVKNVRGIGNEDFMEEWVERRSTGSVSNSLDGTEEGCWHGQPLCNFLMACLVIAFVLPWFIRINMF